MSQFQDAFISYGRADSRAFAAKLNDRLAAAGLEVWIDFDDIPLGVDYQQQIDDGIAHTHNFVFIISPHSVHSPYCAKEIELALRYQKRIIPLMHVEEISHAAWQARHPDGTPEQWQRYRDDGLHSSYPHMHPEISRINWVYCREGIDELEQSMNGLLAIFERQRDYVQLHTKLLVQALTWERHQYQSSFLLIGEARQQAEGWLKQRFENQAAPCSPTDLHCEFIAESIKHGENLMTQVFLAHAEEDQTVMLRLRRALMRQGITVWTSRSDIQTGEDFQQAIDRGIEQADNLVYLISPDALKSPYCQHELDYALSLNKRIVPILVSLTPDAAIPPHLRQLQYIDLSSAMAQSGDDPLDAQELFRILSSDSSYYRDHKILLTQALKWQRQRRNPSILLRGYTLRYAETWLKTGQMRQQQPPTPLQAEFINESLRQPPDLALDVFISYSRAEGDLARRLNEALQSQGKRTWFDQESIASGADFQREIYQGIEASDNFLFLISPRSVQSLYCADEVAYAASLNKRFVTLLCAPIDIAQLPPALARVQWIDFTQAFADFAPGFNELVRTLETDREHVRSHTRWSQRALEWEEKERSEDLLLRGGELVLAQSWLQEAKMAHKQPLPTEAQQELIQASQALCDRTLAAEAARRQRDLEQAKALAEASEARRQAEAEARQAAEHRAEQEAKAKRSSQRATLVTAVAAPLLSVLVLAAGITWRASKVEEIKVLAFSAQAELRSNRPFEALINSTLSGLKLKRLWLFPPQDLQGEIDGSLRLSLQAVNEINRIESLGNPAHDFAISPDGKYLAIATAAGQVQLWDFPGQKLLRQLAAADQSIFEVQFTADSRALVTASKTGAIDRWDLQGNHLSDLAREASPVLGLAAGPQGQMVAFEAGGQVRQWDAQGQPVPAPSGQHPGFYDADISPDGQMLAAATDDNQVQLWGLQRPQPLRLAHDDLVFAVSFSPDGQRLATASWDGTIRLWNLQGQELQRIGTPDFVRDLDFSPDGRVLAMGALSGRVSLLDLQSQVFTPVGEHTEEASQVQFSPDGKTLISRSQDETIRLWQLETDRPPPVIIPEGVQVLDIYIADEQGYLATTNEDGSAQIWDLAGRPLARLEGYSGEPFSAGFSSDGQLIVTGTTDGSAYLWTRRGQLVRQFDGHDGAVVAVGFAPDGQRLATAAEDGQVTIWSLQGERLQTLTGSRDLSWVNHVSFSPDGTTVVTASDDSTAKLWDASGALLHTLVGHQEGVIKALFHPEGHLVATASQDRTVRLWETSTGRLLGQLTGHFSSITDLLFVDGGQYLVSTSSDGTARLWNLKGREIARYEQYDHEITKVRLSQDETLLVTLADDNTARLWPVESFDALLSQSCSWLSRYFDNSDTISRSDRTLCNKLNAAE